MTSQNMMLRHICFTGPVKKTADINFGLGLNLIYGASNTGKSSVLDAIDFMLGRERKLKEIPEHDGYDQIFLGIEFSNGEEFTLVRNLGGGDYMCFQGLHKARPENKKPIILKAKKATKKHQAVSDFIMGKIDLLNKKLKRNANNQVNKLTLRNLLPLSLITETNIQKEASPYIGEQYTEKTVDSSRLKFLLTGVDDSSLIPKEVEKKTLSRQARIGILEELVSEQEDRISDHMPEEQSLTDLYSQQNNLDATLVREHNNLQQSQGEYRAALEDRNLSRKAVNKNTERFAEISEMLERFDLLDKQYSSDILRLEGVNEAGSLVVALPSSTCPLCGAEESDQNRHGECDGNLTEILRAASAEAQKITNLQEELGETIKQIKQEKIQINETLPKLRDELSLHEINLSKLSPVLSERRSSYSNLLETKSSIQKSIYLLSNLNALQKKKEDIEEEAPDTGSNSNQDNNLPTNGLYTLSQKVQSMLKLWKLSNVSQVHFDNETNDFVVAGKHRVSNGKGHRAITHAAATLALMKYAEDKKLANLGFVILDSPLLAYEKPENKADDLSHTDVNKHFFNGLSTWTTKQTIVFENKKSIPDEFAAGNQITQFTKNTSFGRYGFFPTSE